MSDLPLNLLVICADQLRADHLGCYGHPTAGTAHIDALAAAGVRFDQCHAAAPLCGPSRISLVTSMRVGEHGHRDYGSEISPAVPNLVASLRAAGYRTGMFGKNHMFSRGRLAEVWDDCHDVLVANHDDHPDCRWAWSSFSLVAGCRDDVTGTLTDETIAFMARDQGPFLAWVNWNDPHPAFCAPPPYDRLFDPAAVALPATWRRHGSGPEPRRNAIWRAQSCMERCSDEAMRRAIAMYQGQVRYVDDSVGRLVAALRASGAWERTVVLFISDHGELLGHRGMVHKLPVFYDCLTRMPVIIRHPRRDWAGRCFRGLVEEVDLAPTLLDALGVPIPPSFAGRSWCPALDDGDDAGREDVLCEAGVGAPTPESHIPGRAYFAPFPPTSHGPGAMLRTREWKLSLYHDDQAELYHLASDPDEEVNRVDDPACAGVLAQLTTRLVRRLLGVSVRTGTIAWPGERWPNDPRRAPPECAYASPRHSGSPAYGHPLPGAPEGSA